MRSIEASAGTSGRQMRLLTGQSSEFRVYSSFIQTANRLTQVCSPNAMPVSPQDWLHDWLTRACMSCLAFSGPTPSSSSSPVASWPAAQPLVQHLHRGGLYRGGSDRSRSSCALHGMSEGSPRALAARGKGQQIHPRKMLQQPTSRTLEKGEHCKRILPKIENEGVHHCELLKRFLSKRFFI